MDNSSHDVPKVQLTSSTDSDSDAALVQAVESAYSAKAKLGADASYANKVAQAFGYTAEDLQTIPVESHMGLSCGNPVAAASVKQGESVLDLGSGGGIDVLLAAVKAGPRGRVIGLDMSADMIALARRNARKQGVKPPQVSFVQASLSDPLPINSDSIDCILSNCVINLLPPSGKARLLKETHRVLKPGGRIVLDDIVAKRPLPENIRNNLAAYVGCISGAIGLEEYKTLLNDAGFKDVMFVDTHGDINIYFKDDSTFPGCCTPEITTATTGKGCGGSPAPVAQSNPFKDFDANIWVGSYQIYALKSSESSVTDTQELSVSPPVPLLRWWDAYPTPKASPMVMTADEISALIHDPARRNEYAVIDVRGNDYVGGHVKGCFQYPGETFCDSLIPFAEKFGDTRQVVFYSGESDERAPRCAGWYQDHLDERGHSASKAYILEGGIRSWLSKFDKDRNLVDFD